ncbi:hypothetical protein V8C42DRAFT_104691 [Trichoderma barbatum]
MATHEVKSQGLAEAKTGQYLSPAIIVRYKVSNPYAIYFVTPVLIDSDGNVVEGLQGGKNLNGRPRNEGAKGPLVIDFTFADLAISNPGKYLIRLDLYMADDSGATHLSRVNVNPVTVSN